MPGPVHRLVPRRGGVHRPACGIALALALAVAGCGKPELFESEPEALAGLTGANTDVEPPMNIAACGESIVPGPAALRRLSNEEFTRSVRDVFHLTPEEGAQVSALLVQENESRILTAGGGVSTSHLGAYINAGLAVAEFALSTPERRALLASCDLIEESCRLNFAAVGSRQVFRRVPTTTIVNDLGVLARRASPAVDPDPYRPAKLMIAGLVSSPRFLFRVENPVVEGKAPGWKKLSSFEIASRLSYLIWGTNPDVNLTQLGVRNALDQPAQVNETVRAMLADPRATEGVGRFVSRWLGIDDVLTAPRLPVNFPEWTDSVKLSARAETVRFMQDFWQPQGADFFAALTAPYSYVDANLGSLYGIPTEATELARSDLPVGARVGLLTQASVLVASAPGGSETVAPILRGKYLRNRFLCTLPVPAPPDMVPAAPTDPGLTVRERLASHRTQPVCDSCHRLLEPLGFGFEQYDLVGRYRTLGTSGEALSGAGQAFGLPGDPEFVGPTELAGLLQAAPETADCFAQQALQFTYGRELLPTDACAVAQASQTFKAAGFDLKEMFATVALSDAFRFVTVPAELVP